MVGREVPAQTYAVFEVHGLQDIGPTYHYILSEWFPASGYAPANGPDFELYPEGFMAPDDTLYIYFPVEKV